MVTIFNNMVIYILPSALLSVVTVVVIQGLQHPWAFIFTRKANAISLRITGAMHSCRMLLLIGVELIVFQARAATGVALSGQEFMSSQSKVCFCDQNFFLLEVKVQILR